ncbi:helicase-primase primase subunit [Colobine gammaherpesvirus 1]|uniref:Helicase-primase primase subunit n=1 Tax=Colobine gammaherpesvirus 1 TaxID=2597325 RepID=A0A5B8FKN4_9GAMA|nr:helicase-primase primase subunit [Colobine gammaherpesvirus 1]QDQ69263.1 helicase-primase primase subunit [Colobine gammaherpesvirus 1]
MPLLQGCAEVRVIFSTTGDVAETITDVLTGIPSTVSFFSVLYDRHESLINTQSVTVKLCLPVRRPGSGPRCLPVLILQTDSCTLLSFLGGDALAGIEVVRLIVRDKTEELFQALLELLEGTRVRDKRETCTFRSRVFWVRSKFVGALRKLFKLSPSPYWMLSTFGHQEAQFVLAGSFYFFQEHVCTAETLGHLVRLFSLGSGQSMVTINSYEELGRLFHCSIFRHHLDEFQMYVRQKLTRDTLEMTAIDGTINEIRDGLMLSHQELVHFVYLAFFQCLNARAFMDYSQRSALSQLQKLPARPILNRALEGDFRTHVQAYYTRSTYLSTYIEIKKIRATLPDGYAEHSLRGEKCRYWCGQSGDVTSLLRTVNTHMPHLRLQEEFSGLSDMAALSGPEAGQCKDGLLSSIYALPLYRCEFLSRQFFIMIAEDNLDCHWAHGVIFPSDDTCQNLTDEDLTRRIFYCEASLSFQTLKQQLLVSRHEYFNPRLPVYRWVLDFDLAVSEESRTFWGIHDLCLSLRRAIIEILSLLKPVDADTHPVYFFKSACPPNDWCDEASADGAFCRCYPKLGLRVIAPFPPGICVVGSDTMIALTDILNRVVRLDVDLVKKYPAIHTKRGPFDTGIYHRGRSIRLPHCYKVGLVGELTRQLRLIVCHPDTAGRGRYIRNAFTLGHLLHHAPGTGAGQQGELIYRVSDLNENFLENKTISHLPAQIPRLLQRITDLVGDSVEQWLSTLVWHRAWDMITMFFPEDRIRQFSDVTFVACGENLVQLRPRRGGHFLCLNHNHKSRSQGVRVFLIFHAVNETEMTVTFMSQCFANKCNSNIPTAHFSFVVPMGMAN